MLRLIRNRLKQGYQAIRDLRRPGVSARFRGRPVLDPTECGVDCERCAAVCPTGAVRTAPLSLDLGLCVFCGACERACGGKGIAFTNQFQMGTASREQLVAGAGRGPDFYRARSVRSSDRSSCDKSRPGAARPASSSSTPVPM
jgi:formate hydrogenlyase subunit 6/NADH:ubiquinone oxidoreductase subunit I